VQVNPDMRFLKQGRRCHPEFLPDSAEQIAHSIDMTGLRGNIAQAFQAAIARARRGLKSSSGTAINEDSEIDLRDDRSLKQDERRTL